LGSYEYLSTKQYLPKAGFSQAVLSPRRPTGLLTPGMRSHLFFQIVSPFFQFGDIGAWQYHDYFKTISRFFQMKFHDFFKRFF